METKEKLHNSNISESLSEIERKMGTTMESKSKETARLSLIRRAYIYCYISLSSNIYRILLVISFLQGIMTA